MIESSRTFLPGMGLDWLLPLYDPVTRLLGIDRSRQALIAQAALRPHFCVLDVGCGTGTLAVLMKQLHPGVDVVGLDPDPKALRRAGRKAARAGVAVRLDRGFSDALPYPAASFDRVFSSFMLHHLAFDEKVATLREIYRVLKPLGRFHLVDFAGPDGNGRGSVARLLHFHHRLSDNTDSRLLALMGEAGFENAKHVGDTTALAGHLRISHYQASV